MSISLSAQSRSAIAAAPAAGYEVLGLWTGSAVGWLTELAGRRWPAREFALFEGRRVSFGELARWVDKTAQDLVSRGIEPRDRILVQASNRLEVAVLQLASWRIGAVVVPVVPIYREHEMRHILAECRPAAVATSARFGSRRPRAEFDSLLDEVGLHPKAKYLLDGASPGWVSIPDSSPSSQEPIPLSDPAGPAECCTILYTSGTTSAPKGAMQSGRAILSNANSMRLVCGFGRDDVLVTGAPLSHLSGFIAACVLPLIVGCRVVLLPAWKPDEAVLLIEEECGTFSLGAPVFLQDIVERYEAQTHPAHRLSMYMAGGAPTSPNLVQRGEALGIRVLRGYGMTEACGPVSMSPLESDVERRQHFEGQVVLGSEVEAVDAQRAPLPPGEIGELRVRSPQLMLGYLQARQTDASMDAEGWFYTGDVGSVDAEGWVMLAGRIKDIINRGGEKFSAKDIEAAIMSHEVVAAAAVVGVPHERLGEAVCAFVTLRSGCEWVGEQTLIEHLHAMRLAKPKIPVEWHVLDEIPMTASGKVQKHLLLDARNHSNP